MPRSLSRARNACAAKSVEARVWSAIWSMELASVVGLGGFIAQPYSAVLHMHAQARALRSKIAAGRALIPVAPDKRVPENDNILMRRRRPILGVAPRNLRWIKKGQNEKEPQHANRNRHQRAG